MKVELTRKLDWRREKRSGELRVEVWRDIFWSVGGGQDAWIRKTEQEGQALSGSV